MLLLRTWLLAVIVPQAVWFRRRCRRRTGGCPGRVGGSGGGLRGEALVGVVVAGQDQVRVEVVERLAEGLHGGVVAVLPELKRGWCQ